MDAVIAFLLFQISDLNLQFYHCVMQLQILPILLVILTNNDAILQLMQVPAAWISFCVKNNAFT